MDQVLSVVLTQAGARRSDEVVPPRRPHDEDELAGVGVDPRQQFPAGHKPRRRRERPATDLPQECLPAGTEPAPDCGHQLLLCESLAGELRFRFLHGGLCQLRMGTGK